MTGYCEACEREVNTYQDGFLIKCSNCNEAISTIGIELNPLLQKEKETEG